MRKRLLMSIDLGSNPGCATLPLRASVSSPVKRANSSHLTKVL